MLVDFIGNYYCYIICCKLFSVNFFSHEENDYKKRLARFFSVVRSEFSLRINT